MDSIDRNRRSILVAGSAGLALAAALPLAGCGGDDEKEVTATEDMMREHGVLRRALLVYAETAARVRAGDTAFDMQPIADTAALFRSFGEDYHERKLEEAHVFPVVRKMGGATAALCDVLTAQHDRGRQITDYVTRIAGKGALGADDAEPFARTLESFVLMYQNHAAREDTIIFPAWKRLLSARQLDDLGEQFEDIEHEQFGGDGFGIAVHRIAAIEQALGYADLARFTPPAPPSA